MNTVPRIAKNAGVLPVSQIASYIIGFFFILYTARYLGAEGFGILSFALAFTGIIGVFSDLGLSTLTVKEVARDKDKKKIITYKNSKKYGGLRMAKSVAIIKSDVNETFEKTKEVIKLLNGLDIEGANKIAIKPNLCCKTDYLSGATVDPGIVEAVLDEIYTVNKNAKIFIVESDTSFRGSTEEIYRKFGFDEIAKKYHAKLVNLSKDKTVLLGVNGLYFKEIQFPETLLNIDYFISIAKLKTHYMQECKIYLTGALKNQFGCLPEPNKTKYHTVLNEVIVDVNTIIKPDIAIIDGIVAMEGRGPEIGDPKHMGLLIAGEDLVAVDTVLAKLIELNPAKIEYLKLAETAGLGRRDFEIIGESIDSVKKRFKYPTDTYRGLFRDVGKMIIRRFKQ